MFKVGSGSHVKKWNQQPLHIQTAGTEENGWVESLYNGIYASNMREQ